MKKRTLLLAMVLVLGAAAGAYALFVQSSPRVDIAEARAGPAVELVYATGFVESENPVTVSSRVTAPIVAVLVEEGDRVSRGQPLVRLDDAEQRALLEQARADAQGKTLAERRVAALFEKGWVTRAQLDAAVASGRAARAAVSALEAKLDQFTIRAGIAGVVLKREAEPGDLAIPGSRLFELGDPAKARVTATVDERDIIRVTTGQEALLSTDALPNRILRGRVTEITPGGDPDQRAFRVYIALEDVEDLPFGLTLEVNIVTRRKQKALLIPVEALSEAAVWVVGDDDRVGRRTVRTGIVGQEYVEIVSGIAEGERVVVDPPEDLEDRDRVRL